ncbi:MAG TPA: SRPBCC family protein [Acidimicrobiia bacterium]|nr:SRPBCC family protein [Acidimicrobiia bacterium]
MEVKQSVRLPAPVTEVWKRIGGFNALPDWHPMVQKSELAKGGAERKLTLPGGATIVEKLESKDDKSYRYSYSITDSPLPVADYHSTIEVHQEGKESVVEWMGRFEPKGTSAEDAQKAIQDIYKAGMDNLQKMFGQFGANS